MFEIFKTFFNHFGFVFSVGKYSKNNLPRNTWAAMPVIHFCKGNNSLINKLQIQRGYLLKWCNIE